eukprot:scaffold13368_cov75-Phaeocystis_antarctica.AAC.1
MSESQRPRCLMMRSALDSPSTARQSVAPPMRNDLPPKSAGSSPSQTAILWVSALESAERHSPPRALTICLHCCCCCREQRAGCLVRLEAVDGSRQAVHVALVLGKPAAVVIQQP